MATVSGEKLPAQDSATVQEVEHSSPETESQQNKQHSLDDLEKNNDHDPKELEKTSHNLEDLDIDNTRAFKGDDSDGKVHWTVKKALAAASLCGLNAGAQIIVYFVGGCLSYIAADLGVEAGIGWLPVANILTVAAVAPFTGYLEDLLGRRNIAISGTVLICVGCIVLGTAHGFGQALAGSALAGAGAAVGELTALAGISDIVPVRQRGLAVAMVTAFVIPFTPSVLYAQLLASRSTWRWGPWYCLIYNGVVLAGITLTYFPKIHPRASGVSTRTILSRIDYLGGFLSITGLTLLLVALQAGGYTHPWTSAYVLCNLLIGLLLILLFVIWEGKIASYPMIPRALFRGQRIVGLAYTIAFVAGMNFYSILNVYPLIYSTVYDPVPVKIGVRTVGVAICTTAGAIAFNALLSLWISQAHRVLLLACVIMTAFTASLASTSPDNVNQTVALGSLAGIGVGGILVPAATVAMIVVPDSLLATAVAISLSVRTVGGAIGYSIYYNVFANKLAAKLPAYIAEYAVAAGLPASQAETFVVAFLTAPASIAKLPGITASVVEAATLGSRWAYADSLRYVWWTSIAFGSLAIVCCLFMPSLKKYETNRIAGEL